MYDFMTWPKDFKEAVFSPVKIKAVGTCALCNREFEADIEVDVECDYYDGPQASLSFKCPHWWRGISNEIDCNGKRLAVAKWYAVHCWTAKGVPMALSAHWTAPMQQDDMRGEWGPEIIPPNPPADRAGEKGQS